MDRGAWQATVHGATESRHDWATKHTETTYVYGWVKVLPWVIEEQTVIEINNSVTLVLNKYND